MTTATPSPLPVSEPVDQAHEGSGIILGDRAEFPLSTSDDAQRFTASGDNDLPPELSFEDSRALLTRLTGLQPWQLEAFPDELPPLPLSRPGSPTRSPDVTRPSTAISQRRLSSTAVPIRFRKPVIPSTVDPSLAADPLPGPSPTRSRHGKTHSTEFRNSREFRPLYLVERNRKSNEIDEVLPALPPSSASSVVSGADSEEEFESAQESPYESAGQSSYDSFFDPLSTVADLISRGHGPEAQHPELAHREIEEVEESGQATPKASDYFTDAQQASAPSSGPNYESLTAALEHARAQEQDSSTDDFMSTLTSPQAETPLETSAPLDDKMMRDVPKSRDITSAPSSSSSRLQDAALSAVVGGLTAAALRKRSPSPTRSQRDETKDKASSAAEPEQPEPETIEPVVEPSPKGKGKAKKTKKSKKGKEPVAAESPVAPSPVIPSPVAQSPEEMMKPSPSFSFATTFVDNEEDWAKNRTESVVTDDATLVGEPTGTPKDTKAFQQKVLDTTAPKEDESTEVRRAVFDEIPQETARSLEPVEDAKQGLGITTEPAATTVEVSQDAPVEVSQDAPVEPSSSKSAEPSIPEPVIEEEVATTPKSKKAKKNKKGKRGNKQAEPEPELEPAALPEVPTQDDQVLPSSESQQDTIERDILEPSFEQDEPKDKAEEPKDKVDVMDFLVQEEAPAASTDEAVSQEAVPAPIAPAVPEEPPAPSTDEAVQQETEPVPITPANPEESKSEVSAGPATPEVPARPSTADGAEQAKNTPVEENRRASGIEGQSAGSGWGSGLWGAIGWGKKKAPPPPTSEPPSSPKPQSAVLAALAAAREEAKRKSQPSSPTVSERKSSKSEKRPSISRVKTQDETSKPELLQKIESRRSSVPTQRPTEATTREIVKEEASSSTTAPTAIFTDDGKPSFAFPQASTAPQQLSIETPKEAPVVEEKATKQSEDATPSTAFFTDDGKPSFTFPPVSTKPAAEPTTEPEEAPVAKEEKSPAFVSPRTAFFTDNGKPSFTFPKTSPAPAVESSVASREVPVANDTPAPVDVSPRNAFFTDDGKPSFSFPSMPSTTTEQAPSVAKEAEVVEEQKKPAFVAPPSTFFTDDGRPSFAFPSVPKSTEQTASTADENAPAKTQEPATFVAPQTSFFTDNGKPSFSYPSASAPAAPSTTTSKDTIVEEKPAEQLSLGRSGLFTDAGKPTSTISDFVPTESSGSVYDRISVEPSSSKKKIIKTKKEKKAKKSSVPIPDFDEPADDAAKSVDAPVDTAAKDLGDQMTAEPVKPESQAAKPAETPLESAIEAWGEQLVSEPTPLTEEPPIVDSAERTVKLEQPATTEPITIAEDEVTSPVSKKKAKKGKKSKKAELESTEVETATPTTPTEPAVERSLDASASESAPVTETVAEPVFAEVVQEKIVPSNTEAAELVSELAPTVEEPSREQPSLPLDVATPAEREAPVESSPSVQDDAPKAKKSKKNRKKSGISTPQEEPMTATEAPSVAASESIADQPTSVRDVIHPPVVEAVDIPLPAEQPDEDLTQPLEEALPRDAPAEQEPIPEPSSAPVEAELPATPKTKKGKKSKRKSGTVTPQPEAEVVPEQTEAPLETPAPISEPVATPTEVVDRSRDIELPSSAEQVADVETSLLEQKRDYGADAATVPLPTESFDDDLSTPLEQPKSMDEMTPSAEPAVEETPSTPTSKKDKKKMGKKSKTVETPVEEVVVQEEESKSREIGQGQGLFGAETSVKENVDAKDTAAEETESALPREQLQSDIAERANESSAPAEPTRLEPLSETPIVPTEDAPIAELSQPADLVVDDVTEAPSSSKKDKKKKKSKKAKADEETLATPTTDIEAEAGTETLPQPQQQPESLQEASTDVTPAPAAVGVEATPEIVERQIPTDAPIPAQEVPVEESQQPATTLEEEPSTPSKKSKKKKAKKGKSVEIEPTSSDLADVQTETQPSTEAAGPESESIEDAALAGFSKPFQEAQTETEAIAADRAIEVAPEVPVESVAGAEAVPLPETPAREIDEPIAEVSQPSVLAENVPPKSLQEVSTTEAEAVPLPETPAREIDEPIADDLLATLSKKSKKKKAKKGKSADTEPSTPVAEAVASQPDPFTESLRPESTVAETAPSEPVETTQSEREVSPAERVALPEIDDKDLEEPTIPQAEPAEPHEEAPSAELVALPETDDKDLDESVIPRVEAAENVPAVPEVVTDISDKVGTTQPERSQDVDVPVAPAEPAVEAEPAEPISKKNKKKKGKKGKSIDTTEPSTPVTEELAPQFDVPSELVQEEKRVEDTAAPSQETTRTVVDIVEPVLVRESVTDVPSAQQGTPIEEASIAPTLSSQDIENEGAEPVSKKSKKKAKKEKANQEAEAEQIPATPLPKPVTEDTAADAKLDVNLEAAAPATTEQHQTVKPSEVEPKVADASFEKPTEPAADVVSSVAPLETTERSFDDVASTERTLPEISQVQDQVEAEDAPSTPKKSKKKKKGKKGELISEPQTPVTESEPVFPETTVQEALPSTAAATEESVSRDVASEPTTDVLPTPVETSTTEQDVPAPTEPAQVEEVVQVIDLEPARDEPVPEQATEEATPLSKKDKKKAKKSKKTEVESEIPEVSSAPVETVSKTVDEPAQEEHVLPTVHETPIEEPVAETQTIPEATSPKSMPVIIAGQDDVLPSTPLAGDAAATSATDTAAVTGAQDEVTVVENEDVAPATEQHEEESTSKKSKKAKKAKRASIAGEPTVPSVPEATTEEKDTIQPEQAATVPEPAADPTPVPTIVSDTLPESATAEELTSDTKPALEVSVEREATVDTTAPSVAEASVQEKEQASVSKEPIVESKPTEKTLAADAPVPEVTEEVAAPLSKKDKKKAKKAKRVSIAEEPTSIPSTPVEEKTEPVLEEPASSATEVPASEVPVVEGVPSTLTDVTEDTSSHLTPAEQLIATPEPASEELSQVEAVPEITSPVSKKDKKKSKKSKRESIAETETEPQVETPAEKSLERALDTADTAAPVPEQQPAEATSTEPTATPVIAEEPNKSEVSSAVPVEEEQLPATTVVEEQPSEVVASEPVSATVPTETSAEEPVATSSTIDEPSTPSKKDKKKAKKSKRGSVAEVELSLPSTPVDEPTRELAEAVKDIPTVEQEPVAAAVEQKEQSNVVPTVSEDTSASTPAVDQIVTEPTEEEDTSKSKKDKKKAKKAAKKAEAESSEPTISAEPSIGAAEPTLTKQPSSVVPDITTTTTAIDEAPRTHVDDSIAPVTVAAEDNKDKEPATSRDLNEQRSIAPTADDAVKTITSDAQTIPSTTATSTDVQPDDEQEPEEWAGLSKSQKKKLKKANRASVAEVEPSRPATPAEDLSKVLSAEPQSSVPEVIKETTTEQMPQVDEPRALPVTKPISEAKQAEAYLEQPTATSEPTTTSTPAEDPAPTTATPDPSPGDPKPPDRELEAPSSPSSSKKDKKKAKKQAKKATPAEPFLADETPEAANSDTQPSLSIPTLSETQLPFSGIPTQYPHSFTNNGLVDDFDDKEVEIEDAREERRREGEKKDEEKRDVQREIVERGVEEEQEKKVEEVVAEAEQRGEPSVVVEELPEQTATEAVAAEEKPTEVEQSVESTAAQEPTTAVSDVAEKDIKEQAPIVEDLGSEATIPVHTSVTEPSSAPAVDSAPTLEDPIPVETPQEPTPTSIVVEEDRPTALQQQDEDKEVVQEAPLTPATQLPGSVDEADEDLVAPSKKKKKNKKGKRASTLEEQEPATSVSEPERNIADKPSEDVTFVEPEVPIASAFEDVKPLEDVAIVRDIEVAHPSEPQADVEPTAEQAALRKDQHVTPDVQEHVSVPVTTDERQDSTTQPETPASLPRVTEESTIAEPVPQDAERTVENIEEPAVVVPEVEQVPTPTIEEPTSSKKTKKKSKKDKQASSIETVPEVQSSQPEELPSVQLEPTPLASEPINESEVPRESTVPEQVEDVQLPVPTTEKATTDDKTTGTEEPISKPVEETQQPSLPSIERDAPGEVPEIVSEPPTTTQLEPTTSDALQSPTEELPVPSLSKKDKKKSKKAKKQSQAEEVVEETTPDVLRDVPRDVITEAAPTPVIEEVADAVVEPIAEPVLESVAERAIEPATETTPVIESTPVEDASAPKPEDIPFVPETTVNEPTTSEDAPVPVTEDTRESSELAESKLEQEVISKPVEHAAQVPLPEDRIISPPAETVREEFVGPFQPETTSGAKDEQLLSPIVEPEAPLEIAEAAPLSKKDKKKAKKAKSKASDAITPVNEVAVQPGVEAVQDVGASSNEPAPRDVPLSLPQEAAVVETIDPTIDVEPLLDDRALSMPPTEETKEETEKSDLTPPLVDAISTPLPDTAQEPIIEQSIEEVSAIDAPVTAAQEAPVTQEIATEDQIEETVSQNAPDTTVTPAIVDERPSEVPTADVEPQVEEPASPSVSKKKSTKKGRKSEVATPVPETLSPADSDNVTSTIEEIALPTAEVQDTIASVPDEQPKVEAPIQSETTVLPETVSEAPATETAPTVNEPVSVPETTVVEEVKNETVTQEPVLERKLSKKERKKAQKQAAALVEEPIVEKEPIVEPATEPAMEPTVESVFEPTVEPATVEPASAADVIDTTTVERIQETDTVVHEPVVESSSSREVPESTIETLPLEATVEDTIIFTPKKSRKAKKDKKSKTQSAVSDLPEEPVKETSILPEQVQATETFETEPAATQRLQPINLQDQDTTIPETEPMTSTTAQIEETTTESVKTEEPVVHANITPEVIEQPQQPAFSQDMDVDKLPGDVPTGTTDVQDRSVPEADVAFPAVAPPVFEEFQQQPTRELMPDASVEASAESTTVVEEAKSVPEAQSESIEAQPFILEPTIPEVPVASSPIARELPSEEPSEPTTGTTDLRDEQTLFEPVEESSLSRSMSKKAKKAKKDRKSLADSELSGPATTASEAPSEIVTETPIEQVIPQPTVIETAKELVQSPTPAEESAPVIPIVEETPVPAVAEATPEDDYRSLEEQQPIEPIESTTTHEEARQVTHDDSVLVNEPSPSLRAIQDEAADLRLRAEALDAELATQNDADEPSIIEPASMFDIVKKLTKKDEKKARKSKGDTDAMPTTPAAEPEAAVETKEVVETPAFVSAPILAEEQVVDKGEVVETPSLTEDTIATDGPSRKLSKKEKKKKGKQPAVDPVESSETASPSSAPIVEYPEPIAEQPTESPSVVTEPSADTVAPEKTHQASRSIDTERVVLDESAAADIPASSTLTQDLQQTLVEEELVPSRKLSKKDKKRAKQAAAVEDATFSLSEDVPFSTSTESREVALPDYEVATSVPAPSSESFPATSVEASKEVAIEEVPAMTPNQREVETHVDTSIVTPAEATTDSLPPPVVEQQEPILEEPSIPSRKLSKKGKKRAKQDALPAQEPEAPVTVDAPLPKTSEPIVTEIPHTTQEVSRDTFSHGPATVELPIATNVMEEASRSEPSTLPRFDAEPEVKVTEVQPESSPIDLPVKTSITKSTEQPREFPAVRESEPESAIAPTLVRKESKKDKKGKKQDLLAEQPLTSRTDDVVVSEDVRTEERSLDSSRPKEQQVTAPMDIPNEPTEEISIAPVPEKQPQGIVAQRELPEERVTVDAPTTDAIPEAETTPKKSKKQKRKSKSPTTSRESASVAPIVPVEETAPEPTIVRQIVYDNRQDTIRERSLSPRKRPTTPSTPGSPVIGAILSQPKREHVRSMSNVSIPDLHVRASESDSTTQHPLLHKKSSKKHKLAALFERGKSPDGAPVERGLRKEGSGSVRNLAEQYESQSRSVTPILPPSPEKRYLSRSPSPEKRQLHSRVASRSQLGLASPVRSDSKSPARDIDFAATVAASLQESGFDPGYVINDRAFHHSNSISGARDITPDDDIAAAKERAGRSRLGSLSRSSSVSGSPKLRPLQPSGPDVLPPIEVAMATTDTASFDPLDVLNDPAFATRKSPPGVLEEADPDELAGSSSLRRNKSKKKRHPIPETPVESEHTREEADASVAPIVRGKKSKKDEEGAPRPQDRVEYTAAETPAIEAHRDVPLAVETPADSTVRGIEPAQSMPRAPNSTDVLPEMPMQTTGLEAKSIDVKEEDSNRQDTIARKERPMKSAKDAKPAATDDVPVLPVTFDQEARSLTAGEPKEYPFPQVTQEKEIERKEETHRRELEKERDMDAWAPSPRKKSKKSRKTEERVEGESSTASRDAPPAETPAAVPEVHKRRTHPVSFDDEQPDEKRLHTLESTQEPQFTTERTASPAHVVASERSHSDKRSKEAKSSTHGAAPANEPSWSFAEVRNDSSRDPATAQSAQPVEKATRTLRRSKEPKTPLSASKRSIATDTDAEDSPALPTHPVTSGATTPGTDFATKERTSYLFDSSPSTRAYGTSPAVGPQTPAHDTQRIDDTPSKDKGKKPRTESQHGRTSPTKQIAQKEPYQSLFGDPNEKKGETLSTPVAKSERTPGTKQLESIEEVSPDDTKHKKSRSIADVGAPERGLKSARRTESLRQLSDRLRSPPPSTPTPTGRRSVASMADNSGGRDSPWSQVNDSVDRTMTLSPARRMPRSSPSADPLKQYIAEQRSPSVQSQRSLSNIARLRSPDQERPMSSMSNISTRSDRSLRRVDRQTSGDLRSASRLGEASAQDAKSAQPNLSSTALAAGAAAIAGIAAPPVYDPVRGTGRGRRTSMAETFVSSSQLLRTSLLITDCLLQEAWGEAQRSPSSPSRPPSVRKRQSMQIMDLQTQLDQLAAQNSAVETAKAKAEEALQAAQHQRQVDEQLVLEEVEARDRQIHQRDIDIAQLKDTLQRLQEEIARLNQLNNALTDANRNLTNDANERYGQLQSEGQMVHEQWQASQRELESLRSQYAQLQAEGQAMQQQWQTSQRDLEELRRQHTQMQRGLADAVRDEVGEALDERNAEIDRLTAELATAREQIKNLQKQILASKKPSESFLTVRDEDYFDSACQQLCQHVQQWVLRFSKFSDTRACRLSSEVAADTRLDASTRQKIDTRLDNAILDGSDVDSLLADRVKRRDVFMSVVMTMIWEYVFTRYLFGMDREQRQKLKALEKTLSEVGPPRAVAQWRAITLTLLARREPFMQQRAQDTEAVVHEIYSTLSTLLPPPSHLQRQIQESLRNVMRLAVELSIEMRTQRAEYIMLPPLQPEYDTKGDLVAKVTFNASLMNERSGETTSNDELQARGSVVKIVLFPLVVKKGDDFGEGEDEIVVCPAQVLVAGTKSRKVVRVMSGAMSINRPDSRASRISRVTSVAPPESTIMDYEQPGSNMI